MPKGTCPICGAEFYGWALLYTQDKCLVCDSPLIVEREEVIAVTEG